MKTKLLFSTFFFISIILYSQSSLIAYYPFNGNANDESGNANNGTANGATLTTDRFGVANSAYYFDGSSNYISIPDSPNINIQTGESFTISYWIKHNATNVGKYMISKYMGSIGVDPSYGLGTGSAGNSYSWFEFTAGNGIENRGTATLTDNNWHNITTVFKSGESVTIYVDGVLDISNPTSYSGSIINTNNLTIGCNANLTRFYNGSIDDIKIYKKALSEIEIMNEVNGLVAFYPFNGNANDESGSENNGTVNGATLTTDRFGNANSAYYFDGVDNYIQCLFPGPLETTSRTISFWAKTNIVTSSYGNVALSYGIVTTSFDYGARFDVCINSKANGLAVGLGGGELNKAFDNSDGNWHYYTVVFDNSIGSNLTDILFYADGNLLTTTAAYNNVNPVIHTKDEYPIHIGMLYGYGRYFTGSIDEIKIYNKALTATEIQNTANELVAYYPFNGNANDESGNNLNGTVNGATLTTDRFGNSNSAYSFDGSDIITIAHNDILNCSNELSISVWIKPNSQQNAMILGKSNYTSNTNYLLRTNNSGFINFEYKDFANSNSLPLIVNDWNHVAVVSQLDNSKQVYINGVLATHSTSSSPFGLVTSALTIGARSGAEFFNGSIDDIRMYKYALTESNVLSLYNNNSLAISDNQLDPENTFYVYRSRLYFDNTQNLSEIKNISIFNLLAQKVFESSTIQKETSLNFLQQGLFILKVEFKNGRIRTKKILIQ
ncbi:MAG: LamG domain-containing protein [Flavobacteriaceae bacterium]